MPTTAAQPKPARKPKPRGCSRLSDLQTHPKPRNTAVMLLRSIEFISEIDVALASFETTLCPWQNSENWLAASRNHTICATVIKSMTLNHEDVELALIRNARIYQRLVCYTCMHLKLCGEDTGTFNEFKVALESWNQRDDVTHLVHYRSTEERLRTLLRRSIKSSCHHHPCDDARQLEKVLAFDVIAIYVRLVTIVNNCASDDYRMLLALRNDDAQAILNLMQTALDSPEISHSQKGPLIKALIRLSKKSGLHPDCLVLSDAVTRGDRPIARGTFGDVWRGQISGREVAIKVLRVYQRADMQKLLKEFCREVTVWRQLSHPNVLPFYGVYHSKEYLSDLCILSPWMEQGNLREFLKRVVKVDRVTLMLDVAQGLEYLHKMNPSIIHADLKGENVLITPSHRACIADFGLSVPLESIESRALLTSLSTGGPKGTPGYQAPELLDFNEDDKNQGFSTLASDIYAFACVCYEAFSGNRPFYNLRPNATIIAVTQGRRPGRPSNEVCQTTGLVHGVWSLIESCWDQQPTRRPKASNIVEGLRSILGVDNEQRPSDWDDSFILQLRSNLGYPGDARSSSMNGDLNNQSTSFLARTSAKRKEEVLVSNSPNGPSTLVDLNDQSTSLLACISAKQKEEALVPNSQNNISTPADLNSRSIPLLARISAMRNKEASVLNTLRDHPSAPFPKLLKVGGELEIPLRKGSSRLHEKPRA